MPYPSAMSEGTAHAQAEQFVRYEAEQNRRALERMANPLRREEIIVETMVQTGYPAHEAILRRARLSKADLVVIEARKHRLIRSLAAHPDRFRAHPPLPGAATIVKGRAAWRSPRILAALDPFHANDKPSKLDDKIVDAAHAFASLARGSVHAAHVYRPYVGDIVAEPAGAAVFAAGSGEERGYRAAIRRRFSEALERYGIPRSKAHLVCGDPATEIRRWRARSTPASWSWGRCRARG